MPSTKTTFSAMKIEAMVPPTETAAQLMAVATAMAAIATALMPSSETGTVPRCPSTSVVLSAPPVTTFRKIPRPNASAAMPPVLPMKKRIHPNRKPASRPYASLMRTYSPPARGIIALSSP